VGDLISRKALVKELLKERDRYPPMIEERYSFGVKAPSNFNMHIRGGIRKALRAAETAPSVDAEPVRHATWDSIDNGTIRCSRCLCYYNLYRGFANYCPNCGAKMDGGDTIGNNES
jgi:hypothetical protein